MLRSTGETGQYHRRRLLSTCRLHESFIIKTSEDDKIIGTLSSAAKKSAFWSAFTLTVLPCASTTSKLRTWSDTKHFCVEKKGVPPVAARTLLVWGVKLIKFGRFITLIELVDYLRSSVHAGVLCLRRLTKRISNTNSLPWRCNAPIPPRKDLPPATASPLASII